MQKLLYKWIIIILSILACNANAQTVVIDSLKKVYQDATNAESKLRNLLALCQYHQSIQKDSLHEYALSATQLANTKIDKGKAAIVLINAYLRLGKIDSAETLLTALLPNYEVTDPSTREIFFSLSALQVDCFGGKSNYENATAALYKIITLAEKYQDFPVLAKNMSTLGVINYNLDHVPVAFEWYFKGMALCKDDPSYYSSTTVLCINLADAYRWVGKTDSAIYFINKAIPLCEKSGNLFYMANALRIKANIYKSQKKFPLAEQTMLQCIAIRQQTEGVLPLSNEILGLASIYMNWDKTDKAISELTKAISLSDSLNKKLNKAAAGGEMDILRISCYTTLARCYKFKGDEKNYAATLEKIINAKDAFYQSNSAKELAELQTKYELQKKESTIIKQKLDITQKNYLFYGSIIVIAFTLVVFWLLFNNYRRKQHNKMQTVLKEEKRIAAQSIIDAEEQERKRIAADLHDNIGAYASAIRADVEKISVYGIEKNKASLQNLEQHSQEIINSLRDTIWVLNKENITITGVSDRMKNYIAKLQPSYAHIQFHIKENIKNDLRINSQSALNIFRILQEGIHNALKHSQAQNITVEVFSDEKLILKVIDDGKGLERNLSGEGNGLLNMKSRAKETRMDLSVTSLTDKGTALILQTNTTN